MPFSTDAVANEFIALASTAMRPLTPMKLQKLLYYAQGWHLALTKGKPLLKEDPQAWEFGPVFPSVYHEFKRFGARPIDGYAFDGTVVDGQPQIVAPRIAMETSATDDEKQYAAAIIQRIWEVYGKYSAKALSDMTHEENSPWWMIRTIASQRYQGKIPRGLGIPSNLIQTWFAHRFQTTAG